jgi:predicted dehydrogenase
MGDLFQDHIDGAPDRIKTNLEERGLSFTDVYKITPETTFVGFDAYQKVIDSDVDMIILTTPPNFRPLHLKAAVEAGKHVFMEKPVAVDPPGVRSVLESAKLAKEKGLTIVAGTQTRRSMACRETIKRIHEGAIGDILAGQCFRSGSAMRNWQADERVKKDEWSEMEYQIRRWLFWTWLSGDFIVEMHVHNLDVMNWIMDAHPVKCIGVGGRQARTGMEYGNSYDHFSVEYEYPNDVRVEYIGTQIDNYSFRSDERVTGTKGSALLGGRKSTITGTNPYTFDGEAPNPSVLQYKEMIDSIRNGTAMNEGRQVAESTMTAIMGRMSTYTGKVVEWDWALNESKLDLSPDRMEFGDMERRPVAVPGQTKLI